MTSRIAQAERFYSEVLGLTQRRHSNGHPVYDVGGSDLTIRRVPSTQPSEHTVAGFAVQDLDAEMAELSKRGITWERFEYFNHDERGVVITLAGDRQALRHLTADGPRLWLRNSSVGRTATLLSG